MSETVIQVRDVSMHFNLMEEKVDSIKEYVVKLLKGKLLYNDFIALNHISFDVQKGDILGFIGFNGAGKSTLLKILAGVLTPTTGSVTVKGTIAPLIEVGAGFDPELTARENIYLNGAILGYSKAFIEQRFDSIIEFAELKDFVNVPVKNFSSGMYARLGFSIATAVQPDILIVDEVLSVGDFRFQQKCEDRIRKMIEDGVTILLVSHDMDMIERLCNKVLWLDHGEMKDLGATESVCEEYKKV
ncbi:ABC transporter ATP-binding protein [Megasphaera sp.]|jgi:ABC-type polysaccharide/polyol phosphate transport system ATPase subunit|uniref:ABC transporter ATP-binding protein n=1 Tax=Megasphaera sp. TaxID=2023260 RepID=UPI0026E0D4D4|nr:ABC transporter ATP-binding protein [uncultured Megasphaera sp.]